MSESRGTGDGIEAEARYRIGRVLAELARRVNGSRGWRETLKRQLAAAEAETERWEDLLAEARRRDLVVTAWIDRHRTDSGETVGDDLGRAHGVALASSLERLVEDVDAIDRLEASPETSLKALIEAAEARFDDELDRLVLVPSLEDEPGEVAVPSAAIEPEPPKEGGAR